MAYSYGKYTMFEIVLFEPEIPPNTGNIARTCAVTACKLHLIKPLGFEMNDKKVKRSGMDYWQDLEWKMWENWHEFISHVPSDKKMWFVESGGDQLHTDVSFSPGDFLVFGRESTGLPHSFYKYNPENWITIPMINPNTRSLNLSNCVAIVVFEALRQHNYLIPSE